MDLLQSMQISAAGMRVQGERMRVSAQNMANADTTATEPGGDPYRRKTITFKNVLDRASGIERVAVDRIQEDNSDFRIVHNPSHPAADETGHVTMPNINPLIEMLDIQEAQRSYEANLGTIRISRGMINSTVEAIGGR